MSVVRLTLENFRRFSKADFAFAESGITLITGPNGAGKSTLLESVYLLGMGKSPREVRFTSLLNSAPPASYFRVHAETTAESRSVSFLAGSGVAYHVGDRSVKRSELIGKPPVVLFSADEMHLVTGAPALRRRFLDRILSQENPDYLARLKRYTRTLEERNALLKMSVSGSPPAESLLALDETLTDDANVLTAARRVFVTDLKSDLPAKLESLGSPHLAARVQLDLAETAPGNLLEALIDHRARDLAAGHTTVGPHRDDLVFRDCPPGSTSPGLPASDILSQGEIRILSLALKCIEADRLARSARPILLFDDLFSELDELRRAAVSEFLRIYPGQVLLTSCLALPPDLTPTVRRHLQLKTDSLASAVQT